MQKGFYNNKREVPLKQTILIFLVLVSVNANAKGMTKDQAIELVIVNYAELVPEGASDLDADVVADIICSKPISDSKLVRLCKTINSK